MTIDANTDPHDGLQPKPHSSHDDERRSWMRFGREPGTDYAMIVSPKSLEGRIEVIDESLGGFGFVVDDPNLLQLDQSLEVVYAETFYRARVRHISPRPDGRFTVGVSCR